MASKSSKLLLSLLLLFVGMVIRLLPLLFFNIDLFELEVISYSVRLNGLRDRLDWLKRVELTSCSSRVMSEFCFK